MREILNKTTQMRKYTLLIATLLWSASASFAQKKGFLNKINDKLESIGTAAAASGSNSNAKEIAKDMEDAMLESKPVNKDSRNISGIYYSNSPIKLGHKGLYKFNYSRKFLINYNETPGNIEIISRHHYDASKELPKWIYEPAANSPKGYPIEASTKLGHLYIDNIPAKYEAAKTYIEVEEIGYHYFIFNKGLEGAEVKPQHTFPGDNIFELEPGILFVGNLEDIQDALKKEGRYKVLQDHVTYLLFYKKEKEERALSLKGPEVWDKLKDFYLPYRKGFKEVESGSVEMAKPIATFKEAPTNPDLVKASKTRMAQTNWQEELLYVYPVTAWANRFENIGIMGKTLTHRVMQVQAVLKDKSGQCMITQFMIRQDNTYSGGSNAEKFTGNPIIAIGDTDKSDVNCTKAMQYKK